MQYVLRKLFFASYVCMYFESVSLKIWMCTVMIAGVLYNDLIVTSSCDDVIVTPSCDDVIVTSPRGDVMMTSLCWSGDPVGCQCSRRGRAQSDGLHQKAERTAKP